MDTINAYVRERYHRPDSWAIFKYEAHSPFDRKAKEIPEGHWRLTGALKDGDAWIKPFTDQMQVIISIADHDAWVEQLEATTGICT
jgi:hypothetical protein